MGELLESKKLKPCPFCGSENVFLSRDDFYSEVFGNIIIRFMVQCTECGANVHSATETNAKEKWNRRA